VDQTDGFERLQHAFETCYAWKYTPTVASLRDLYAKAKGAQWDGATYLPWSTDVDPESPHFPDEVVPIYGSDVWTKLTPREQVRVKRENAAWTLSQFLHGEQGALLASSQIVSAVPSADAKFYGATQVVDEARHVEVYDRYLREKLENSYPISRELKSLLDTILTDARWDMKYLGMQIMVEGLALAAFRVIHMVTTEPLLKSLIHMVMRDEARHVAFGVLSLKDYYSSMEGPALREREDFVLEASRLMRDRFLAQDVWERTGLPLGPCLEYTLHCPMMVEFRRALFSTIVPNLKRLALLTPRVRAGMEELGVLQFEHLDPDESLPLDLPGGEAPA
jgi:hypothetical protein